MKKNKIEVGQCYEKNDKVYEVIRKTTYIHGVIKQPKGTWWLIKDTLTKERGVVKEDELVTWRRPFPNWG